jgi:hypothetical protein
MYLKCLSFRKHAGSQKGWGRKDVKNGKRVQKIDDYSSEEGEVEQQQ